MGRGVRSSARLSGAASTPAASVPSQGAADAEAQRAAAQERRARAKQRAQEVEDSPAVLRDKCRRLARALREAKHLVVYTGAGISTAADIPDYRGPHGVWTRLQRGETIGRVEVARAQPTFTHMALTALWASGTLKFVVSQNCDGLHLRAGLPRRALAELHGDMFAEQCVACRRVYLRAFDTTERTARHAHATRRLCHACGRELRDTIVHFGERGRAAWPLNWAGALRHAAAADVVLCLGSSLKVLRRYPRLWRMQCAPHARPALYIVNLQWTPKDAVAKLKINARCDAVMAAIARRLRLRVPRYSARRDPLLAHAVPLAPAEAHTAGRHPLPPPPLSPPDSDEEDYYSLSSPSSSSSDADDDSDDSDDGLPLQCLAERLRASRPPLPATYPTPAPFPALAHPTPAPSTSAPRISNGLCSFQVRLKSGEATILLRAEHAPTAPAPPPEPPPRPVPRLLPLSFLRSPRPPLPPAPPILTSPEAPTGEMRPTMSPRALTSDLRRFRMQRMGQPAPHWNGVGALANGDSGGRGAVKREADEEAESCGSKLRHLLEDAPWKEEPEEGTEVKEEGAEVKEEEGAMKEEEGAVKEEEGEARKCKVQLPLWREVQAEAEEAAAAFIRRAVLVCRASLYPGLHTIVAGERGCAWCLRRHVARRCLWYGPPPAPGATAGRAARRVRGQHYLCACCPASAPAPLPDDAGWFGKGYRKGRRRKR